MRILYGQFEIRGVSDDKYEVVLWSDEKCSTTCITVAFIEWSGEDFSLKSVGMRFLKYYKNGLSEFIDKFVEFLIVSKGLNGDNVNDT